MDCCFLCFFQQSLRQMCVSFYLSTAKLLFVDVSFKANRKKYVLLKIVLRFFKIFLCLREQRIFMWQLEIFNAFNTYTLKQVFWKTKTFFKKLEYRFYLRVLWLKMPYFHTKLLCQKPMLRKIKEGVQNAPVKKNAVLSLL